MKSLKRKRPRAWTGKTYNIETPDGNILTGTNCGNSGRTIEYEVRLPKIMKIGNLCPECGDIMPVWQAAAVNEEGGTGNVRPECYACGFSMC